MVHAYIRETQSEHIIRDTRSPEQKALETNQNELQTANADIAALKAKWTVPLEGKALFGKMFKAFGFLDPAEKARLISEQEALIADLKKQIEEKMNPQAAVEKVANPDQQPS